MNQMQNMSMGGPGAGMQPNMGNMMSHPSQQQQMNAMNPMAKMQGMANGGYPQRRMAPYPSPQMHAAQKRGGGGMYPMNPNGQNVPQQQVGMPYGQQQMHPQAGNGVPVPMQAAGGAYGRPGPMGAYGRMTGGMTGAGPMGPGGMGPVNGGMGPTGMAAMRCGGNGYGPMGGAAGQQPAAYYPSGNGVGMGMGGGGGGGAGGSMCPAGPGAANSSGNPYQNQG